MPYHSRPVMPGRVIGRYAIGGERLRTVNLTQGEQATLQGDYYQTWFHAGPVSATAATLVAGTANPGIGAGGVVNPAITSGASHFFGFRTPTGMLADALRFRDLRRLAGGELKYYVYVNVPDFTDGRALTIFNENALSPKTAQSQFHYLGTTAPSVTGGIIRDFELLPDSGGVGGNRGGSFSAQDAFRLLPIATRFILEVHNPTNNVAEYSLMLQFAEVNLALAE